MPMDREAYVAKHSLFYRNGFRRLLLFSLVLVVIIFAVLALIFYQHYARPKVSYFVTTSDGRLIEIHPG